MRVLVDLNRCQSYGQCVFSAPNVFRMSAGEALEWDYEPDAAENGLLERARHACPVQAIALAGVSETAEAR